MPPRKPAKPSLVVGPLTRLPKDAGTRVKMSLKPAKKASYTAYQNITVTLGDDTYDYSEAWSLGAKGTQYDTFLVPEERRDEKYRSVAYMWIEPGGVDRSYRVGTLHDEPWGTAKGRYEKRTPPDGALLVERATTLTWDSAGKMRPPKEQRRVVEYIG